MSVHSLQKLAKNISNNRWTNEFTQGEKIGKGGFASVYQAKNHFDENDYAVKKIKLRVNKLKGNTQEELERILTESKFLARVNHHNVLRYYNSWLEIGTKRKEFAKPACNYGKNKGDWREIGSDEEEESEDISTYDSLGDVDSPAVVFDRSSPKESDDNDFIFECSQSTAEQVSKGFSFGYEEDMEPVPQNNRQKESAKDIDPILEALTAGISEEETVEKIMLFIQTELCSESLADYIASRNQKLASIQTKDPENYQKAWKEYLKEAIAFAKQILAGLAHIHSHGIVHRDLKPQNIFLSNKVCKIGDFGLIKMSNASNSEASSHSKSEKSEDVIVPSEKSNSKSDKTKGKETPVGAVGTKTFASPEQWAGDDSKSDFKSDIFSLGVTLLLLFHPITTSMEELKVISDCKTGKLPSKLEKELPEIASIIKKMLAVDPCNRPSLKAISASLNVPVEIDTELTGNVVLRKEDSDTWESRHFKIVGKNFCVFKREQDKKAENIYVLPEWAVLLENASDCDNNAACITLEDPMRLGCTFRMENCEQTNQLFNQIQKYVQ